VAEAFFVDAAAHGWMAPIVMVILPGGMALFWGGACALARVLGPREGRLAGVRRLAVFAASFGLFEWLRGHVLTGFPWNLPGETWAAGSAPSQAGALMGPYALSVATVVLGAAPALLWGRGAGRRERLAGPAVSLVLLAGAVRLRRAPPRGGRRRAAASRRAGGAGDIDQTEKWRADNLDGVLDTYLGLTQAPGQAAAQVVIWPEGAIPSAANDYLGADVVRRRRVAAALLPGQTLLTGAFRVDLGPDGAQRAFNTALAVQRIETPAGPDVQLTALYDKHRLVPLGEFLPLRPLLEPLGFVRSGPCAGGLHPRPPPRAHRGARPARGAAVDLLREPVPGLAGGDGARPLWIVNQSNDSWFGRTSGPWQHLNIASHRAVEQGLPVIRADLHGRKCGHRRVRETSANARHRRGRRNRRQVA
jgi:apolipoprotein N-acyltransferase